MFSFFQAGYDFIYVCFPSGAAGGWPWGWGNHISSAAGIQVLHWDAFPALAPLQSFFRSRLYLSGSCGFDPWTPHHWVLVIYDLSLKSVSEGASGDIELLCVCDDIAEGFRFYHMNKVKTTVDMNMRGSGFRVSLNKLSKHYRQTTEILCQNKKITISKVSF